MLELLLAFGQAKYALCGTNGCWREPPAPYEFKLTTKTADVGIRWKSVELRYRDLGTASVRGQFSADVDYDSQAERFTPGAQMSQGESSQHTTGISLAYAPRFSWGRWNATPSLGVMHVHQTQRVMFVQNGQPESTAYHTTVTSNGRYTPIWGLKLGVDLYGGLGAAVGYEMVLRPRYLHSLAGGGSDHKIGLRLITVEVRYAF